MGNYLADEGRRWEKDFRIDAINYKNELMSVNLKYSTIMQTKMFEKEKAAESQHVDDEQQM